MDQIPKPFLNLELEVKLQMAPTLGLMGCQSQPGLTRPALCWTWAMFWSVVFSWISFPCSIGEQMGGCMLKRPGSAQRILHKQEWIMLPNVLGLGLMWNQFTEFSPPLGQSTKLTALDEPSLTRKSLANAIVSKFPSILRQCFELWATRSPIIRK